MRAGEEKGHFGLESRVHDCMTKQLRNLTWESMNTSIERNNVHMIALHMENVKYYIRKEVK